MAFENVNTGKMSKITELKVGESLTGYLLAIKESTQYEGRYNLSMLIEGERTTVPAVGNLHYIVADGKLVAGRLTRITREENKKVKGGKTSTQVFAEQDKDDTIEVDAQASMRVPAAAPSANLSAKIASLKG